MIEITPTLRLLLLFTLISLSLQSLSPIEEKRNVPLKLFEEFPGYQLMLHYDNITSYHLFSLILYDARYSSTFIALNYNLQKDSEIFKRPVGYKYLHIVYLEDAFLFEYFTSINFNLEYNDIVIFIIKQRTEKSDPVWKQTGLDRCGCIFIYDIESEKLRYVHYYVGNSSGMLKELNATEPGESPKLLKYRNHFKNFQGHIFQVAYFPYEPFIWCVNRIIEETGEEECVVQGIDGQILLLLSQYLNFKFVMKKAEPQPGGGLWNKMIRDVHFRRRDWAVGGISTSLERLQLVDFTTVVHMESYTAFYVAPKIKAEDWSGILRPFHTSLWLMVMFLLICVGSLVGLSQRVDLNPPVNTRNVNTLQFVPFRAIIDQSAPGLRVPHTRIRFILSIWFLASIILNTCYKSILASTMIRPVVWEPNTVLDLYRMGFTFQVNSEDWTVLKEGLANSLDTRYGRLLDRCFDDLEFCAAVKKSLHRKVAIFDEETGMAFIIFNGCRDLYGPNELFRFRLVRQQLFPSVHAWPLQLGAPYTHRFSRTFQTLKSAGIVEHWYESLIGRSITRSNTVGTDSSPAAALTTKSLIGPATILLLGTFLATIVFVCEHIYRKYSSNV